MDTLNYGMMLSIGRPTLNSHNLIVPRIKNSDDWKVTETTMERIKMQSTYETTWMCKIFLTGTQASDRMHHITFQWIQWHKQGAWVLELDIVGNTNPMVWLPYLSRIQNRLNGLSVIISSHFMIENVRLLQSQFLSIFIIFVHFENRNFNFHPVSSSIISEIIDVETRKSAW